MQNVIKGALFTFTFEFFRENLGQVSEEHGERFHQDIAAMEKRYQGRWDTVMMGDYIWSWYVKIQKVTVGKHVLQCTSSLLLAYNLL